ncbi:MAG: enoyl-CoA hydratase/isomerase family protein [Myxococcota bacterium]
MDEPAVLYESSEGVGVLTLNRPDNRNSMTPELLDAFREALGRAQADEEARCIVITGRGKCFSAGADFKSQMQREGGGRHRLPHERSYGMYRPFLGVLDLEVPVIGALNGHAVGGGFGLALVCDVRYGARDAKYGANFARIGLHPGMGISYLLPRLVGASKAAELLFTGALIQGEEAERIGLLSRAVAAEEVLPLAMDAARTIAANAPLAVRMTKRTLRRSLGWDVKGAAFDEAFAQAATLATRDAAEGMAALLEKRDPDFKGA